jgi:asparagine synthase (glutamine-hydrolysing)
MDIRAYWDADYPDKNIPDTRTVPEMIQGVRERLVEAIRLRLRADVPCGVYLSGGIDSSCIAGIASEILKETDPNARLRAFSIAFAGSDKYDESQIAERTAEFCDADFQKLSLTEDDLLSNFEESIWYVEQPHFNLNGVGKFLLSGLVREQGYKVVLTGEGSDEHFAGYAFFHADLLREADLTTPNGFGTVSNKRRLELFDNVGKSSEFEKYTDSRFDRLKVEENTATRRLANNTSFHTVLSNASALNYDYYNKQIFEHYGEPNPGMTMAEAVSGIARGKANSKWHPLHTSLYIENHTFLPNYLCNHLGDRSEMAHSVEARTPFLDHHFTEYVNSLPPSVKIKIEDNGALNEKWILKEAVKPYITEEMYNRTKHPFVAPGSKGRSESIVKLMNKLVTQEKLEKLGWVNVESLLIAKEEFLEKGDPTLFKDLLGIMSYVVLADRFNVAPYTRFNTGTVVR